MPEVAANYEECDRPLLLQRVQDACAADVAWPEVLNRVLALTGEELHFGVCSFWRLTPDSSALVCQASWRSPKDNGNLEEFVLLTKNLAFPQGFGLPGRVWQRRELVVLDEIDEDRNFIRAGAALGADLRSAVGAPAIKDGELIGVLECIDHGPGIASDNTLGCLEDIAAELAKTCP